MTTGRRGSYAKGIARREEILERALEVVGRDGFRSASVKEIADAVGLTQAGLLHYFDSKEELFVEVLRRRDQRDTGEFSEGGLSAEGFLDLVRYNASVPGLVELFSRMAVEAADPTHPAHSFFIERGEALRRSLTDDGIASTPPVTITPETAARLIQAAADGLQLQWLQDPSFDMAEPLGALLTLLNRDA